MTGATQLKPSRQIVALLKVLRRRTTTTSTSGLYRCTKATPPKPRPAKTRSHLGYSSRALRESRADQPLRSNHHLALILTTESIHSPATGKLKAYVSIYRRTPEMEINGTARQRSGVTKQGALHPD
ncbi:hypothetical protein HYALB_00012581 [Hymenoscyphus albidus]|uniref:Uncharacterized protein n=1 Tax=Hymenoscyphus albidus TaxID=595503 RepID=A0A9N9Q7Z4_9HELO|nr:hypothetical protein HYALB_00012581 [Hymenoscyphus albidus]